MTKTNRFTFNTLMAALALGLFQAQASAQEVPPTRAACDAAYTACFSENGFAGFFICPWQYGQCLAQAAQITQTISKLAGCGGAFDTCRSAAGSDPDKLAACGQTQRECVASALGIDTDATEAASACIAAYDRCAASAENTDEYGMCISTLRTCLTTPREPN